MEFGFVEACHGRVLHSKGPFSAMQYPKADLTICLEKVRWVREIWEELTDYPQL